MSKKIGMCSRRCAQFSKKTGRRVKTKSQRSSCMKKCM